MGKVSEIIDLKESIASLEEPVKVPTGLSSYFKKGKLKIVFIYEDGSYSVIYKNVKKMKPYFLEYKKKLYQLIPKAILNSRSNPMIIYFYNNPAPLLLKFQSTKLTSEHLYTNSTKKTIEYDKDNLSYADIFIDSEGLYSAFNSNLLKGLYANNSLTWKNMLIIGVVAFVMILIVLQLTGSVDVFGMITGQATTTGGA